MSTDESAPDREQQPDRPGTVRDLDTPESGADAVRGGFLGGLIKQAGSVVRPVAPNATPSIPIPPPAE